MWDLSWPHLHSAVCVTCRFVAYCCAGGLRGELLPSLSMRSGSMRGGGASPSMRGGGSHPQMVAGPPAIEPITPDQYTNEQARYNGSGQRQNGGAATQGRAVERVRSNGRPQYDERWNDEFEENPQYAPPRQQYGQPVQRAAAPVASTSDDY